MSNILVGMNNGDNPIDVVLKVIKPSIFALFIHKWSKHKHNANDCWICLIVDGNWKLCRSKCLFGGNFIETEDFGFIDTGCTQTPMRNSYYCAEHQKYEMQFKFEDNYITINPVLIIKYKPSKF